MGGRTEIMHVAAYPRWLMVDNAGEYWRKPAGVGVGWRFVKAVKDGWDRDYLLKNHLLGGFLLLERLRQLDIIVFGSESPLSLLVVGILKSIGVVACRSAQREGRAAYLWGV